MAYFKYDGSAATETSAPTQDFYGTSGLDTLTGTGAAESFWGGQGDLMTGGGGDDTYYLSSTADRVVELAGGGIDKIVAWRSIYLSDFANIENLKVDNDKAYGAGNAADNVIEGGAGSQQLYGGLGQDVLVGGAGADTFIVVKGEGNDVIQDFSAAEDVVRLNAGLTSFAQVQARLIQVGADVKLDLGDGDGLMFRNLTVDQLTASNFSLSLDTAKLGAVTFADEFSGPLSIWDAESNPTGVWRPDYGYAGSQGLDSYTLSGNGEKQIYTSPYFRDHAGDFKESPFASNADGTLSIWARPSTNSEIFGYGYTSGLITTKQSFAQLYGYFEMRADLPETAGAWPAFWLLPADGSWPPELDVMETLTTDPHADWTTAHSNATGSHTSDGASSFIPDTADGFHTYGVLWTATDLTWYVDGVQVFHAATPADMNKPMYMLANLALGGWGGTIDNAAMPTQMKIDYIKAWSLADGGSTLPPTTPPPAPTYSNSLFALPESAAWTRSVLGAAKPDRLVGTSGADFLDGKGGVDTLTGGGGDDTYGVDRANDTVVEQAGGGVDTVLSTSSSYTLGANVENLKLTGTSAQSGTGNDLANRLVANDYGSTLNGAGGDDILVAGRGGDVLTGGAGKDIFQFDKVPTKAAEITDFLRGEDMIDLRGLFRGAGYGGSDPVKDGYLRLQDDGAGNTQVWFDADGAGSGKAALVITVDHVAPTLLTAQNDWFFA